MRAHDRSPGPSKVVSVLVVLLVVLSAGCMTATNDPPYSGAVVAEAVDETPTNTTVVPYSSVDLEEVRIAVRNASDDPDGFGETDFTESDWRTFDESDLGRRLVEFDDVYVRYRDRVFRVDLAVAG